MVAAIFVGLAVLASIAANMVGPDGKEEKEAARATMTPEERAKAEAAEVEAARRELGLVWTYSEKEDAMGRGVEKTAWIKSTNQFEFDPPYSRPQQAKLVLRNSPKYGRDVILQIERGQFLCRADGCRISIRFDEGKAQRWDANEAADGSSEYIFLHNQKRFVDRLRKAKSVQIEASFFQQGSRVMEFAVEELEWQ